MGRLSLCVYWRWVPDQEPVVEVRMRAKSGLMAGKEPAIMPVVVSALGRLA